MSRSILARTRYKPASPVNPATHLGGPGFAAVVVIVVIAASMFTRAAHAGQVISIEDPSPIQDGAPPPDRDAAGNDAPPDAPEKGPEADVESVVENVPEFDRSSRAVAVATKLFNEAVRSYRNLKAVRDEVVIRQVRRVQGNQQEQESTVPILATRESVRFTLADTVYTAVDGTLYGERDEYRQFYFAYDYDGDITLGLFSNIVPVFGIPYFPLLYGSESPLMELSIFTIDPTIAGYREYSLPGSDEIIAEIQIDSAGEGAPLILRIDKTTKLVTRLETVLRDPMMDPEDGVTITVTLSPELLDEVPLDAFLVETDDRKAVDELGKLFTGPDTTDLIGEPAPRFTLPGPDGEQVRLQDLLGHVIVIVFWSIPSEGLLPVLDGVREAAQWADEQGILVKILAVSHGDPPDEAKEYWVEKEYTMSLLLDQMGTVGSSDYRIPTLPTIVIISADGHICQVRTGIDMGENVGERIRKDLRIAAEQGI